MMYNWQEIDENCDAETALKIAHEVASASCGCIEIEFVGYKDSEFVDHHDDYEAEVRDDEFHYCGSGHGASVPIALMRAVKDHLKQKEENPKQLEETKAAVDNLTPDQMRDILKSELDRRHSTFARGLFSMMDAIRKYAGMKEADIR